MKLTLIFTLFLSFSAQADTTLMNPVQPYPSEWPPLANIISECTYVTGTYIDPNKERYLWEERPESRFGSKISRFEGAWLLFGFKATDVRASEAKGKIRTFAIEFGQKNELRLRYFIDGEIVVEKTFAPEDFHCTSDGMTIIVSTKTGKVYDWPNLGFSREEITLNKSHGYLYVRSSSHIVSLVLYAYPSKTKTVRWFRFSESRR